MDLWSMIIATFASIETDLNGTDRILLRTGLDYVKTVAIDSVRIVAQTAQMSSLMNALAVILVS